MTPATQVAIGTGAVLGVAALAVLVWRSPAVRETLHTTLNPFSDRNVAYGTVNRVGEVLTQDKDFNLGAWLWEKTHPGAVAAEERAMRGIVDHNARPALPDLGIIADWPAA